MTTKLPLTLALAALVGLAAPALAAEHAAKHDPQAAGTTAKPKAAPPAPAKDAKAAPVKGRHAKSTKARAPKPTAATPAPQPAVK
jgi:hypothetical protein